MRSETTPAVEHSPHLPRVEMWDQTPWSTGVRWITLSEMTPMKAWLSAKKTDLITAAIVIGIVLLLIVVVPYCC